MTLSERLAEAALAWRYEDLPEDVAQAVRWHLLDALGVGLAAASLPAGGRLRSALGEEAGPGPATVLGEGRPAPMAWAALVNGALIHSLEYDDTHTGSIVHASSVLAASALAAAEAAGASGRELVAALAVGWEAIVRLGLAAPGAFQAQGFQTTAVCGPPAAALVVGRLLGLGREELVAAVGIAVSQAGGVFEYLSDGSDVKALHPGWAAHAGAAAALLARAGMRGPRTALEGRFGLYRTHAGTAPDASVFDDLGRIWHVRDAAFKAYPCCHYSHAFLDAALALRREGVRAEDVVRVECTVPAEETPVICEPWERKQNPRDGYDAKFSLPYAIAAAWVDGRADVDTFSGAARPELLSFASRVTYTPASGMGFPDRFPARLAFVLADGTRHERYVDNPGGTPSHPWGEEDVVRKWRANAGRLLAPDAVTAVEGRILRLEAEPDVRTVGGLLRAGVAIGEGRG